MYFFLTISAQPSRLTGYSRAPIIEPSSPDVTYSVYSKAKLECKSDKPITWISEVRLILTKKQQSFNNSIIPENH